MISKLVAGALLLAPVAGSSSVNIYGCYEKEGDTEEVALGPWKVSVNDEGGVSYKEIFYGEDDKSPQLHELKEPEVLVLEGLPYGAQYRRYQDPVRGLDPYRQLKYFSSNNPVQDKPVVFNNKRDLKDVGEKISPVQFSWFEEMYGKKVYGISIIARSLFGKTRLSNETVDGKQVEMQIENDSIKCVYATEVPIILPQTEECTFPIKKLERCTFSMKVCFIEDELLQKLVKMSCKVNSKEFGKKLSNDKKGFSEYACFLRGLKQLIEEAKQGSEEGQQKVKDIEILQKILTLGEGHLRRNGVDPFTVLE